MEKDYELNNLASGLCESSRIPLQKSRLRDRRRPQALPAPYRRYQTMASQHGQRGPSRLRNRCGVMSVVASCASHG
jgi:hypothetical protein